MITKKKFDLIKSDINTEFILKRLYEKLNEYKFNYPSNKLRELSEVISDLVQKTEHSEELSIEVIKVMAEHDFPPISRMEVLNSIFEKK